MRQQLWDKTAIIFAVGIFLTFVAFDVIWCMDTTFASFSFFETYATKIIATLALAGVYALTRCRWAQIVVMALLDVLLVANLMYFRTYYSAIPASSYLEAGNLADFKASVTDSLRWADIVLPLITIATAVMAFRYKTTKRQPLTAVLKWWAAPLAGFALLLTGVNLCKGGFHKSLRSVRQSAYLCSADAPIFSVFGCIWYDITDAAEPITPEKQAEIERWLASQPKHQPADSVTEKRSNLLIVFAESLESWVLEKKVDGKEITPCLNRLLKEKSTLYAPNVLTQVKGGRSIDAQLMICSGLLPLMSGTYSSLYYDNTFYTLQKAMRGLKHSRSYLLTIDKVSTWNQGAVARSFGTDTIISYHDFKMTEAFGTHKRIGDASFFQQCREKIERGEVWKPGESVYMQFVTYSGHAPFKLPDHLRTITFPASIPEKAADYMTTAHYTDKAIGDFVAYLKTLPQYKETIVVIVGDHEGLASYRQELVGNPACRGLVSDKQLTPFIVLNSPVGMRYDKFMGQIDIYPTLLNLMQLDAYRWHGLGQSILDPRKQGVAVGSVMNVEGTGSDKEVERLKEAHTVSDYMLRYDWLKRLD
ncbi:MAG: LTA synthase family protein [Bacteroidales bacterium]|jgi:lipoteichoic acid synthase|nr:LTA synthase family protein [Bacteroidales bacterium]DAI59306.1 MAG TPA: synthase [Crassvirales sp.]